MHRGAAMRWLVKLIQELEPTDAKPLFDMRCAQRRLRSRPIRRGGPALRLGAPLRDGGHESM